MFSSELAPTQYIEDESLNFRGTIMRKRKETVFQDS